MPSSNQNDSSTTNSKGTIFLGLILAFLLCCETGLLVYHSTRFTPSIQTAEHSVLRMSYWPESQMRNTDEGDPLADWLGVETLLSTAKLTQTQQEAITKLETETAALCDQALKYYGELITILTPAQRQALNAPQKSVADSSALGIDSTGQEQQIYCLYRLSQLALTVDPEASLPKPSLPAAKYTDLMAPTRYMIGITKLIDEPDCPITPVQARAILKIFAKQKLTITSINLNHSKVLSLLTSKQIASAKTQELRRFEAFISPAFLHTLKQRITLRQKGSC